MEIQANHPRSAVVSDSTFLKYCPEIGVHYIVGMGGHMLTQTLNINEVRAQLSQLVEEVATGSEVIIAKGGKPIARLSRIEGGKSNIRFGILKGKVKVADDFDAPLPDDILSEFEG